MIDLQWAQALSALVGASVGAAGGIFAAGWRLGRIESRLELEFKKALEESERRIEENVRLGQTAFDETLRGLREKINSVELESEKRFLLKGDFNDFRDEYRDDIRELKGLISKQTAA